MITIDTHVLIWWITDPKKLSPKAGKIINTEKDKGLILVSSISVWEIYLLIKKNRLRLNIDAKDWFKEVESLPFVQFIPVNNSIAAKSVNLPGDFHLDPADRMIVATAQEKGTVLITSDDKIRKYRHVQTVW